MKVTQLFVDAGLVSTKKEAKRLMQQGGARINDIVVDNPNLDVSYCDGNLIIGTFIDDGFLLHECCHNLLVDMTPESV